MGSKTIKIFQQNLNRDRAASHQLREACKKHKIDYLLVQEPLVNNGKIYAFESCTANISASSGAAIISLTNNCQTLKLSSHTSNHMVAVKIAYGGSDKKHVVLVSAYFKYNQPKTAHVERLEQVLAKENRTIICAFLKSKKTYEALTIFARAALTNRTDR